MSAIESLSKNQVFTFAFIFQTTSMTQSVILTWMAKSHKTYNVIWCVVFGRQSFIPNSHFNKWISSSHISESVLIYLTLLWRQGDNKGQLSSCTIMSLGRGKKEERPTD